MHSAAAGGTAMTRMTPELPDPALHSDGLAPDSFEMGTAARDALAPRALRPQGLGRIGLPKPFHQKPVVSLSVPAGCFLRPSASARSALLRVLRRLLDPATMRPVDWELGNWGQSRDSDPVV